MSTGLQELMKQHVPRGCNVSLYSFTADPASHSSNDGQSHCFVAVQNHSIIYAIEALLYHQPELTTIYVAKVDSTGCHDSSASPISGLTFAILCHLLTCQTGKVRFCLFARAQPQYIFPFSAQNPGKHVLEDRRLVQWWLKMMERVLQYASSEGHGYLLVPGQDESVTKKQVPSSDWSVGHPYDAQTLASEAILSFPDDPKSRFLQDLKSDKQDKTVTVAQFWELMAFRQEMSFGHAIAFITVEVDLADAGEALTRPDSTRISLKEYKKVLAALQAGVYASVEETETATRKWLEHIKARDIQAMEITGEADIKGGDHKRAAETQTVNQLEVRKRKQPEQAVNTLLPRKKVPKST